MVYPKDIITTLSQELDIQFHPAIFPELGRINSLPDVLKEFSHTKKLSYKQLLNIANTPTELIMNISTLDKSLPMSASLLLELCQYCHQLQLKDVKHVPQVQEILNSHASPTKDKFNSPIPL